MSFKTGDKVRRKPAALGGSWSGLAKEAGYAPEGVFTVLYCIFGDVTLKEFGGDNYFTDFFFFSASPLSTKEEDYL